MESPKHRQSNIELLRIIAMLMIVAHHFALHGCFVFDPTVISVNCIWIRFLQLGGKISVDIFVLISGLFMISDAPFRTSKVIKLWLQMLTYSVAIYAGAVLMGFFEFSGTDFLDACLPVLTYKWWFATAFFKLYILSPFINIALKAMSRRVYLAVLTILLLSWCIIPTVSMFFPELPVSVPLRNDLTWFITLYSIAAYVRLWHWPLRHSARHYLTISLCMCAVTFLSAVAFDYLNFTLRKEVFYPTALYEMYSPTILAAALFAVTGFSQLEIPYNRKINMIAAATFGVYLLHDHDYTRPLLWQIIFRNASYAGSSLLIPYSLAVILLVYTVCTAIELLRINLLEKHYMPFIRRKTAGLDRLSERKNALK